MHAAYITLLTSIGFLLALSTLFSVEKRRGSRLGETLRSAFDRGIVRIASLCSRIFAFFARDAVRQSVHYLFHQILRSTLSLVRSIERHIYSLLRRNRAKAKKVSGHAGSGESKLDQISEHMAANELSPKEKRDRKERSIGTKL